MGCLFATSVHAQLSAISDQIFTNEGRELVKNVDRKTALRQPQV
jgi:hypothetical protein